MGKILIIEDCKSCPNANNHSVWSCYCNKIKKEVLNFRIPEDCPLPDKKEANA